MLRDWSARIKTVAGLRLIVVHTSVGRSMANTINRTIANRKRHQRRGADRRDTRLCAGPSANNPSSTAAANATSR